MAKVPLWVAVEGYSFVLLLIVKDYPLVNGGGGRPLLCGDRMEAEVRLSGRHVERPQRSGAPRPPGPRGGGASCGPERSCAAQGAARAQSGGRTARFRPCPPAAMMAGLRADPELAKRLFFEGAAVIVLGVPEGTEFGIDYSSWTVGPRFRGVKMVPPGVHFVHCSAARSAGGTETGPRAGLFLCLRPRQVRALRWEPGSEELRDAPGEEEALGRDLRDMDAFLGPYPYDTVKKWIALSSFVGEAAVERLRPESGRICAFSEVLPVREGRLGRDRAGQKLPPYDAGCGSYAEGVARLPEMRPRAGTEIRFTELPRRTYPEGASPEEITRHCMDLSYALENVIARRYAGRPQDLLAELQFAFICFLIGNVYDAFEHWKRLLNILCRSEAAIAKYQDLYANLIFVLYHQLNEIPSDFFVDIVSQDNFLTSTLQVFFSYTCSAAVDGALRKKAEKFKAHLTKKFKWDFEAEPDDCAPVVVELSEGVLTD